MMSERPSTGKGYESAPGRPHRAVIVENRDARPIDFTAAGTELKRLSAPTPQPGGMTDAGTPMPRLEPRRSAQRRSFSFASCAFNMITITDIRFFNRFRFALYEQRQRGSCPQIIVMKFIIIRLNIPRRQKMCARPKTAKDVKLSPIRRRPTSQRVPSVLPVPESLEANCQQNLDLVTSRQSWPDLEQPRECRHQRRSCRGYQHGRRTHPTRRSARMSASRHLFGVPSGVL